jgi:Pvc16 N-terminal domain
MIRDLSLTLQAILSQSGRPAELASARIVFDRPTAQFSPTQTSIDLFLYDIRENLDLRSNKAIVTNQDGKATIQPPPIRLACSYLVTAWPIGVSGDELFLQEHRLLSQAFNVLSSYETIPDTLLQNSLKGQEPPVPIVTSHIDNLKTTGEFWTALGNQLRPSISVTMTISQPPFIPKDSTHEEFIVTTVNLRLENQNFPIKSPANPSEAANFLQDNISAGAESFRIGGQITGADNKAVPNAAIRILENALNTTTNKDGVYNLGPIDYHSGSPPQTLTLRVKKDTSTRDYPIVIPAPNNTSYNFQFP